MHLPLSKDKRLKGEIHKAMKITRDTGHVRKQFFFQESVGI